MTILERKEQLQYGLALSYVRTDGKVGICPQAVSHRVLAEEDGLILKMIDETPVVDDGGVLMLYSDHIEIAPYKTTSTIISELVGLDDVPYDRKFEEIRARTALTIANITKLPVMVNFRFTPSQTIKPEEK